MLVPNIHLLTLHDFMTWAGEKQVTIHETQVLSEGEVRSMRDGDNLHAEEVLLIFGKG